MTNFSVGAKGYQYLSDNIDTNKNQRIEQSELSKAADQQYTNSDLDVRNDGNVTLGEANDLAQELNRYIDDPKLVSQLATASLGSAEASLSFGFDQEVVDLKALKFDGSNSNYHLQQDFSPLEFQNSPADAPYMLENKGFPVSVNLEQGMYAEWPPEKAEFVHPKTGQTMEGYQVKLSTGDQIILPPGQEFTMTGRSGLHNDRVVYSIDANGNADKHHPNGIARYSTTFCTRRKQI